METDYVVVGTGSAGSVLANRLSADQNVEIAVLEAGPRDKDKFIHIPAAWAKLFRSPLDWDYLTEPQKELAGREIYWPRGKMLGGSSSINAMMWVRGFAADYDEWGSVAGRTGTTRMSRSISRRSSAALVISPQRSPRSSTAAWLKAVQECGYLVEPPNRAAPEGFCETIVTQRRGARWSTADAYLDPVLRRRKPALLTEATATRVLFDGTRAVGVEFEHGGRRRVIRARREVVLCGGAINSPQLLLVSGIGDREQLAAHGIDVVQHAPQVGKNLIDHLCAPLGFDVKRDALFTGVASLARRGRGSLPHPRSPAAEKPWPIMNYLVRRRGMLTSNCGEAYGFIRSRPDLQLPDLELMFVPAPFFDEGVGDPYEGHAVLMWSILLKPHSRGSITLRSRDPKDKPIR